MVRSLVWQGAHHIAPTWAAGLQSRWWQRALVREAKALRQRCLRATSLEEVVDEVLRAPLLHANQKRSEILELLSLLREVQPRYICEIGGEYGGSLCLFCQVAAPDARILSIDIGYTQAWERALTVLGGQRQRVTCLGADSHAPDTLDQVREWLGENALDFLFIDGDHTHAGVSQDFEMYSPLVRPGGIIAFHDIVPDFRTRYGTRTGSDVGQVPAFWNALKREHPSVRELIEDPDQDGFGIGVVWMPGSSR